MEALAWRAISAEPPQEPRRPRGSRATVLEFAAAGRLSARPVMQRGSPFRPRRRQRLGSPWSRCQGRDSPDLSCAGSTPFPVRIVQVGEVLWQALIARAGPIRVTVTIVWVVQHGDSPPAGWYIDPRGRGGLRWWDGIRWTDDMADAPSAGPVPPAPRSAGRLGDPPNDRPVTRPASDKLRRIVVSGLALALIGIAIWTGAGKFGPDLLGSGKSATTVAPAAAPAASAQSSSPPSVTVDVAANQGVTFNPPGGLQDGELIVIAAAAFESGEYTADECKAGTSDEADCNDAGLQVETTNAPGGTMNSTSRLQGPLPLTMSLAAFRSRA